MDVSFLGIAFVTIATMFLYIMVVLHNKVIPKKQNIFFILCAVFIIFIIIIEIASLELNDSPVQFRWLNFLVNFFGFAIIPLFEYCLGRAIVPDKKKSRWFFILWCIYLTWMIVSSISGDGIFTIDANNHYSRNKGFPIYTAFMVVGILFVWIETFFLVREMQFKGAVVIWLAFVFVYVCSFIQIIWPEIHIAWLGIAYSVTVYYIYYNNILQQLDPITGLFNLDNFLVTISSTKNEAILITIELENFSRFRDTYNRNVTNTIIKELGNELKAYYKRYGKCFRLSPQEFCVIVQNTKLNFDVINKAFYLNYINNNYNKEKLTLINVGYTKFNSSEELDSILTRTDASKRKFLEDRLHYFYN